MNEYKENSKQIQDDRDVENLAGVEPKKTSGAVKILLALVLLCALALPLSLMARIGLAYASPRLVLRPAVVKVSHIKAAALAPQLSELANSGQYRIWAGDRQYGLKTLPQQGGPEDQFVLGGQYTLDEGEYLDGNLVVMGGIATLEESSTVAGDVLLLGGTVRASGEIDGEVFIIGGLLDLSETALVRGDVNAIGGHVEYENRESVEGEINTGIMVSPPVVVPGEITMPQINTGRNWFLEGVGWTIWYLFKAFLWTVVAVLVLLFLQQPTERVTSVIVSQPIISVGLGLMTAFVAPLLLAVIAITIIGIPVSLLGFAVLALAWAFGLVAVGTEIGKRLARGFNQEWALAVQAALGTLILVLVLNAVSKVVPCIGWIAPLLAGSLGLGAVLLTRFGTQDYPTTPAVAAPGLQTLEPQPAPELIRDAEGEDRDMDVEEPMDETESPEDDEGAGEE